MSSVATAYNNIRAAAHKLGGLNFLADKAGVNVETARRLVRNKTSAVENLEKLEAKALEVLSAVDPS